ncbi:hypothetical protein GCM10023195_52920 [Actinoallomurus liliacearum]|uniref:Uncharacterized protein n=1 Tax=Actinoallomurus liliacearum TaxID=1080073 RepID=A0ABP8TNI4_9ACTN
MPEIGITLGSIRPERRANRSPSGFRTWHHAAQRRASSCRIGCGPRARQTLAQMWRTRAKRGWPERFTEHSVRPPKAGSLDPAAASRDPFGRAAIA